MSIKVSKWAKQHLNKTLALAVAFSFLIGLIPLAVSAPVGDEPMTVIDTKTLERGDPVVMLGSAFPAYVTAQYGVDNLFVWAHRDGEWRQVVFQIDEANITFRRKDNPNTQSCPHKNFYIPTNGYLENTDEIVFMANETGDRVNQPDWAPGANTSIPRYEITVVDPLDTGKRGWAYLFYHDTPPEWTTVSYVSWDESNNFLDAYGYSLNYFNDLRKRIAFHEMTVSPNIGGTGVNMVDREKRYVHITVTIDPMRSEYASNRGLETYHEGYDNDPQLHHEYGIVDGPVRVLRHIRWGFGSADLFDDTLKMGWRSHNEYKYYSNMFTEDEYIRSQAGSVTREYYRSVDHLAAALPMTYYNSLGGFANINGNPDDDSVPSGVPAWGQVSSAHGSYVSRFQVGTWSSTPPGFEVTNQWIDDAGAADTDGARTGAETPGRYGEHGVNFYNPSDQTNWQTHRSQYATYFMGANMPNVGQEYHDYYENPLLTNNPSPQAQAWVDDNMPPETVAGSLLVDGESELEVPISEAGQVLLTATVTDVNTGNSNVISAVYTNGFANFPGTAMAATDGSFDSPSEDVQATIDLAALGAGVHHIHVYGTDQWLNMNTTSTEHAIITIIDDMAPATVPGSVLIDGEPNHAVLLSEAAPVHLTATVDDTGRGNSDIISAVWTPQFAEFPGTTMDPVDGAFDSPTEDVEAVLDLPDWDAGVYHIHVYGTDATPLQNTTSVEHAVLTIIDDVPPLVADVLLNGEQTLSLGMSEHHLLNLTALVDDTGRGGTVIGGANFTMGMQNWGSSTPMTPAGALDSATEEFSNFIDVTGWEPGTYMFYVYGWDSVPNSDIESAPHAVLVIINDFAPEIGNVLVDGLPEISVPLSARGVNELTATLDNSGRSGYNIAGANYTMGMANWATSTPMEPLGVLNSPVENFTADVDASGWAVGTYDLYVYGWDQANNFNVTSLAFARINIYDDLPPIADTVRINGAEVYETDNLNAGTITITAWVDDTLTGNSNIGGAEYTVGPANWPATEMYPVNTLDSPREQFTAEIDISSWSAGTYMLYPYGWDAVPNYNTVPGEYATLIIHDIMAPTVSNVRINGTTSFQVDFADATTVELTALLDDTGRGDSEIGGANWTMGFRNWGSGGDMLTHDDEALADLPVTGIVSGTYQDTWKDSAGASQDITEAEVPGSEELVTNGIFMTNYNPWTLTRPQNQGASGWDGTQTNTADGSGSVTSSLSVTARNEVRVEEALWAQDIGPTTEEIVVNGAYRVERNNVAGNINYNRGTVQVQVYDTSTGWQTIYNTGALSASVAWTDFGPDATYTPTGEVTQVRVRHLVEISTGGGGDIPNVNCAIWSDDISVVTVGDPYGYLEHRWHFDMGSSPTFYVDASNPATSDNDFKFQYSTDSGAIWNDFPTNIQYAPGEVGVLKFSAIPLATYYDDFQVRVISVDPGPNADTFSVDRMWAEGQFNNNPEAVYSVIDISDWQPGLYRLYVYGWDKSLQYNTTSRAHATLQIFDNVPPEIHDFLVDGAKHRTVYLSEGEVTLTGTVDDSRTGNSNIAWARGVLEDGEDTIEFPMANDTAMDSPTETFTEVMNISTWPAGFYRIYMHGADVSGMVNDTFRENVTIEVIDDMAPATQDWSIKLDGSSQVWLNPEEATEVTVTAVIDDSLFGYSNITAAQWTVGPANFTGNWMEAADGLWDNYTKQVTGIINVTGWDPGDYYIYVYGTDEHGNAQTYIPTYAIIHIVDLGPAIEGPWAGPTLNEAEHNPYVFVTDNSFVLKAYGDTRDRGRSNVVAAEYFVDTVGEPGTGTPMANIGFRFDSPYEGARATIDSSGWEEGEYHTYHVHFQNAMGVWGDMASVLVMKQGPEFQIPVHLGWNLISIPLVTPSGNVGDLFSGIGWNRAYIYDPMNPTPWLSHGKDRPAELNRFDTVDLTMGIWVHVTDLGAGHITVSGGIVSSTQIILRAGWNLVGYPTLAEGITALNALAGTGANMIAIFDSQSPYVQDITDLGSVIMEAGKGYWVHVPADTVWVINW